MSSLPKADYIGKVRDLYYIDEQKMIISATDRVSAFDVVFDQTIPGKGQILNHISSLWFNEIEKSGLQEEFDFANQIITDDNSQYPAPFTNAAELKNRSVLVKRTQRVDFECVVRGYLTGSGWKDYQKTGSVCGNQLPTGLLDASKIPELIFTPATKADIGEHDENVTFATMQKALGNELAQRLKTISIAIFNHASKRMAQAGIILCDTKFEFGLLDDKIILIDEALTPDSSRYWNAADYSEGEAPPGYDKQFIRNFAANSGWNKKAPAPTLPTDVIEKTQELYNEIKTKIEKLLSN